MSKEGGAANAMPYPTGGCECDGRSSQCQSCKDVGMQEQRDREAEEGEKSAEAERKWWARHGIKTRCTWSPSTTCEMPSRCHTMAANALPHEMPPCGTTHCHHCRYCGCAVCDVCMGGTINVHRWISSEQGHPVSWIDKQGITHRGEVPAHARVGVSPKKVCRLCAEYAKQEVNTRVQLNFILDAIDAKAAEIQAAEATGTEPEPKSARRTTPAATPRATVISTHRKAMLQLAQKARGVAHWLNKPARQLDQGR